MDKQIISPIQWIWYTKKPSADTYGDFRDTFTYTQGKVSCRISCDGDYVLFVNDNYVSSVQYDDFAHYKIYDELDITPYLHSGENRIYVLVWHFGVSNFSYRPETAGLWYEIACGDQLLTASSTATLCRQNPNYRSGYQKIITSQLGFSFLYDATANADIPFTPAVVMDKHCDLYPRPMKKLVVAPAKEVRLQKIQPNHYLIDCTEESVGFPVLRFHSSACQKIMVAWGEHIEDGCVRQKIGSRDFSFEYIAKEGYNDYTNYMVRLGGRYLEVFAEAPIDVEYIGILPHYYPTLPIERTFSNPLDQKIYDVCLKTLNLCMMEHYVDTPWREQGLYGYDSRNQMIAGYHAFENGNREYVRANLLLISKDTRDDGLHSITYPTGDRLAIPSFALHYITAVREYMENTGDLSLGEEVYDKILAVLDPFIARIKDGLLYSFPKKEHWNFYEWSKWLDGEISETAENHALLLSGEISETCGCPDLMLNSMFLYALRNLQTIASLLGRECPHPQLFETLQPTIHAAFYCEETGLFSMSVHGNEFTEFGNAFAILSGLATASESQHIAQKMLAGELAPCTLSSRSYKYEALLKVDAGNLSAIIDEIRSTYQIMLDADATSVWETIDGASAFDNAGSLCHAWSSIPICYLT